MNSFTQIAIAYAWPLSVLVLAAIFYGPLKKLLSKLSELSVGPFSAKWGGVPGDGVRREEVWSQLYVQAAAKVALGQSTPEEIGKAKPANIYWLAHDLMNLFDAILRGANRDFIVWQIRQANHHFDSIGLQPPLRRRPKRSNCTSKTPPTSLIGSCRRISITLSR